MDLQPLFVGIISLVLGSVLTFATTALTTRSANRREDSRESREDAKRQAADGREHAKVALQIIRDAERESWTKAIAEGEFEMDLGGYRLDVAEAEIDLIPDPILRRRLVSVLSHVQHPGTLANSSYTEGAPVSTQRRGLHLLRQSLAAYVREEPTPFEADALAELAASNDAAHAERAEWDE